MSDPLTFASVTSRLELPLLFAAQAHKELFHNEALARIDALMHPSVEAESNVAPDAPLKGACWLVGPEPTGAWSGSPGTLAMFQAGGWQFAKPFAGMRVLTSQPANFCIISMAGKKPKALRNQVEACMLIATLGPLSER